jgi:hypothetical protein
MAERASNLDVYLEIGKKRVFVGAIDWPGWCRSGRDELSAIDTLIEYGPRYADVLHGTRLGFHAPRRANVHVAERLQGDATTDFGAPATAPSGDRRAVDDAWLRRSFALLSACWAAFDSAVEAASGRALVRGPRGGGRELGAIVEHVIGADAGYLRRLAWKHHADDPEHELARTRDDITEALTRAVRQGLPSQGPRGGAIWTPRYFVRRVAWHVLDHVWEIQDRAPS